MANSDDAYRAKMKRLADLVTPFGHRLRARLGSPLEHDAVYVVDNKLVDKSGKSKWVLSIYGRRSITKTKNAVEIAIDLEALADPKERRGAESWLNSQREELELEESEIHQAKIDAWRIGMTEGNAQTFLSRLSSEVVRDKPEERWLQAPRATPPNPSPAAPQPGYQRHPAVDVPDAVQGMLDWAYGAAQRSGQETTVVAKNKEIHFASREAFAAHVAALLRSGRCALSDLPLDMTSADPDLAPSLDRKNSDGHYAPGNLQVVARFINRWKSDRTPENFARLLALVRAGAAG